MAKKNYSGVHTKGKINKHGIRESRIDKRRKNSDCFVSTVCFGESSIETQIFRNWRDEFLSERYWGVRFISWYYRNGENLSKIIGRFYILKLLVGYILTKFARLLGKRYQ